MDYIDNPNPPTDADAIRKLNHGMKYPYVKIENPDAAQKTALGILADLTDRRGVKHELYSVDDDVRVEIVNTLACIIRVGMSVPTTKKFKSIKIAPFILKAGKIEMQSDGPDNKTVGWGVYLRLEDNSLDLCSKWVTEDEADMCAIALRVDAQIPIEPKPWSK
jgi:hypothetical protein